MKLTTKTLKAYKPKTFKDINKAVAYLKEIYETQTLYLQEQFDLFTRGKRDTEKRISAFYPYARIKTEYARRVDTRLSYGFASKPGVYSVTLTRPDLFETYYREQFELIIKNHDVGIEIGISDTRIPVHFALGEDYHLEQDLDVEEVHKIPDIFDVPDLDIMDDEIANGTYKAEAENPLALFTAPRVDLSLQRLKHYCGSKPSHFQNYVIFTNYQFYIDEFIEIGRRQAGKDGYTEFVEPDNNGRLPQMPAYHLKMEGNKGITMVNIGVGPSNAKTITDHIAVLRPHAWLMLGHCAGLRNSQKLGDYVLAHGYLRMDHVLDEDLPTDIPIPALAEVQVSLENAVA